MISTDKNFITWLKLRINNVASGSFEKSFENFNEKLKSLDFANAEFKENLKKIGKSLDELEIPPIPPIPPPKKKPPKKRGASGVRGTKPLGQREGRA